jgi:hypothetical protein
LNRNGNISPTPMGDSGVLGAVVRSLLGVAVALTLCAGRNPDRQISIINNTNQNLLEIHISTAHFPSWGFDQLGDDILTAGDAKIWNLGDLKGYCHFDLAFRLRDRSIIMRKAINICKSSAIYVAGDAAAHR